MHQNEILWTMWMEPDHVAGTDVSCIYWAESKIAIRFGAEY